MVALFLLTHVQCLELNINLWRYVSPLEIDFFFLAACGVVCAVAKIGSVKSVGFGSCNSCMHTIP